jgi:hypothetical protein
MALCHIVALNSLKKKHNNKVKCNKMTTAEAVIVIIFTLSLLIFISFALISNIMFNNRTENYKLVETQQIYNTHYNSQFSIDKIKKCFNKKHGKLCHNYYVLYAKKDNKYYKMELRTDKTQLLNTNKAVASLDIYEDCQFFQCDYKYEVNLPILKKIIVDN